MDVPRITVDVTRITDNGHNVLKNFSFKEVEEEIRYEP